MIYVSIVTLCEVIPGFINPTHWPRWDNHQAFATLQKLDAITLLQVLSGFKNPSHESGWDGQFQTAILYSLMLLLLPNKFRFWKP